MIVFKPWSYIVFNIIKLNETEYYVFYKNSTKEPSVDPLTYNIESYSWYKLRSRFERKSKMQTYKISNQILNFIKLNIDK